MDALLTLENVPCITDAGSATPCNMQQHLAKLPKLKAPPEGFAANDARFRYSGAWQAAVVQGELLNFQTPNSRKLLEVDFFARSKLPTAARHWILASLATFILFAHSRFTIKTSPGGNPVYGNLKDGNDATLEIENICTWLMDPVACPTTWAPLLAIRNANPLYGTTAQPTVA